MHAAYIKFEAPHGALKVKFLPQTYVFLILDLQMMALGGGGMVEKEVSHRGAGLEV